MKGSRGVLTVRIWLMSKMLVKAGMGRCTVKFVIFKSRKVIAITIRNEFNSDYKCMKFM